MSNLYITVFAKLPQFLEISEFNLVVRGGFFRIPRIARRNRFVDHIVDTIGPKKEIVVVPQIRFQRKNFQFLFPVVPANGTRKELAEGRDKASKSFSLVRRVSGGETVEDSPGGGADKIFNTGHILVKVLQENKLCI